MSGGEDPRVNARKARPSEPSRKETSAKSVVSAQDRVYNQGKCDTMPHHSRIRAATTRANTPLPGLSKMLVKGVFTNISGSIGGVTGSRNKGGQYLRARTTPVNPNSAAQQQARTRFTDANEAWATLSVARKESWDGFSEIQTATNRLGDPITLSGQNAFIGSYSSLEAAGITPALDPPAPNTQPPSYLIPEFVFEFAGDINAITPFPAGTLGAGDRLLIGCSPNLPPGVSRFKGPFRNFSAVAGNAIGSDIETAVQAAANARIENPPVGSKFAIRIIQVRADGAYSSPAIRVSGPTVE